MAHRRCREKMKKSMPKLSQAQAIIIAAIITGLVSGYFVLKAAISPTELTIQATQTAEAKLTQASLFLAGPSVSSTAATSTAEITSTPEITNTPTTQNTSSKESTEIPVMITVETSTNLPSTLCENSVLYTTNYALIYDQPGGNYLSERLDGGTELNCIKEVSVEPNNVKYYVIISPIDGKEVAISWNNISFDDPRTCFKLYADDFPQKVGYLYYSFSAGYSGTNHSMKLIRLTEVSPPLIVVMRPTYEPVVA